MSDWIKKGNLEEVFLSIYKLEIITQTPKRGIVQNMDWTGLDSWTGQLDWTIGLDGWTGQLDWTVGLDSWTGLLDWISNGIFSIK